MIPAYELWEEVKRLLKMFISKSVVEMDFRRFVATQLSPGFCIPRAKNTN